MSHTNRQTDSNIPGHAVKIWKFWNIGKNRDNLESLQKIGEIWKIQKK